jgi:hypothetical protein
LALMPILNMQPPIVRQHHENARMQSQRRRDGLISLADQISMRPGCSRDSEPHV